MPSLQTPVRGAGYNRLSAGMDIRLAFLFFTNILVGLCSIIASLLVWRKRETPGLRTFPLYTLGILAWCLGSGLALSSATQTAQQIGVRLVAIGVDILPLAWLLFILYFTNTSPRLSATKWAVLLIFPVASQVAVWVNNDLPLFHTKHWFFASADFPIVIKQTSLWGWMHALAALVLILAGNRLLLSYLSSTAQALQRPAQWIALTTLVPMIAYLLEISGMKVFAAFDVTPLAFVAWQWCFLWSMRRGPAVEILPLARQRLVEHMEDGVMVLDSQGQIIDLNPAAAQICGEPLQKILRCPFTICFPEMEKLYVRARLEGKAQAEVELGGGEHKYWLDVRISALPGSSGTLAGQLVQLRDITRRKQAEDAYQESEERYRQVTSMIQEGVIIQNTFGGITNTNPSAERILGLSAEQMMGRTPTDPRWRAIHEDRSPFPGDQHPALVALRTGEPQSPEVIGVHKPDGSLRWLSINAQPLFKDGASQPHAVISTFVDITENRLIEQNLRDSEIKFRELVESAPVAVVVTDDKGRIRMLNTRAEQMFICERDELLGKMVEALLPERIRQKHTLQRREFTWAGEEQPMHKAGELFARRSDGSEFPVEIRLNTVHTSQGNLIISYLTDTSEHKRAEEALRQANEQLVHSLEILETHTRELTLLGEMGDMLHNCANAKEAYAIVASYSEKLFISCSGALYLADQAYGTYEAAITWGPYPPEELVFTADKCWALRRGRAHSAKITRNGLNCKHINPLNNTYGSEYICIPLQAQDRVFGVFHLRCMASGHKQSYEQLAITLGEHITMSLFNLALREDLRVLATQYNDMAEV